MILLTFHLADSFAGAWWRHKGGISRSRCARMRSAHRARGPGDRGPIDRTQDGIYWCLESGELVVVGVQRSLDPVAQAQPTEDVRYVVLDCALAD
jgi:hypothetical protein